MRRERKSNEFSGPQRAQTHTQNHDTKNTPSVQVHLQSQGSEQYVCLITSLRCLLQLKITSDGRMVTATCSSVSAITGLPMSSRVEDVVNATVSWISSCPM